uniref:hypothetical protein n=1 Tax=Porphyridium aerugineum TaxID=2792 RepID=UPI001FCCD3E1|nr:hypothetical protein MW505_pgp096 [Porphyridium aerugineum]UNJ17901.1 hypothetical protein [Porphyridium aerugineum]
MSNLTYEFITLKSKEEIILDLYFSDNIYWILSGSVEIIKMDNSNNCFNLFILGPHKIFKFLRTDKYYYLVRALSSIELLVSLFA